MALVAWSVNELANALPWHGLTVSMVRVSCAISLATLAFYASCRLLRVEELNEAVGAIGDKLMRRFKRR